VGAVCRWWLAALDAARLAGRRDLPARLDVTVSLWRSHLRTAASAEGRGRGAPRRRAEAELDIELLLWRRLAALTALPPFRAGALVNGVLEDLPQPRWFSPEVPLQPTSGSIPPPDYAPPMSIAEQLLPLLDHPSYALAHDAVCCELLPGLGAVRARQGVCGPRAGVWLRLVEGSKLRKRRDSVAVALVLKVVGALGRVGGRASDEAYLNLRRLLEVPVQLDGAAHSRQAARLLVHLGVMGSDAALDAASLSKHLAAVRKVASGVQRAAGRAVDHFERHRDALGLPRMAAETPWMTTWAQRTAPPAATPEHQALRAALRARTVGRVGLRKLPGYELLMARCR